MTDQLLSIIAEETGESVTRETPLDSLRIDSLEFLQLMLALGNASGKSMPDERIAALVTVGDLIQEFA